jgi:4-azaleucine resistance transporter AzlC
MKSESVTEFRRGLLAMTPLMPGIIVFGFLYGVLARQAGLTTFQAWGMSMTVFAGSAQFVAAGLWDHTAALTIIITTFIVNLRHILLGLSIGPYLAGVPGRCKVPLAFWLTDESYAISITEYRQGRGSPQFLLGASLGVYLVWPFSGLAGALAGTAIPDPARWGLNLIFPLAFMGLLMAFMEDWTSIVVAVAAGVIALIAAQLLPGSWYVIVAGVLASTLGLALERGRDVI